jgi:hypothetical protein
MSVMTNKIIGSKALKQYDILNSHVNLGNVL